MPPKQQNIPGLTLQQLLRGTAKPIVQRGQGQCRLLSKQYGPGSRQGFQRSRPRYPTWYNEMRVVTACTTGRRYSYVRFYGPPAPGSPAWVWCSCEHFAYHVEYVLAQYGCSTVSPGLENRGVVIVNEPPRIRNPNNLPFLCKHLILAAGEALKQTRDYAAEQAKQEQKTATTASQLPVRAPVPRQPTLAQQTVAVIPQQARSVPTVPTSTVPPGPQTPASSAVQPAVPQAPAGPVPKR
jgi:hypothetical protein